MAERKPMYEFYQYDPDYAVNTVIEFGYGVPSGTEYYWVDSTTPDLKRCIQYAAEECDVPVEEVEFQNSDGNWLPVSQLTDQAFERVGNGVAIVRLRNRDGRIGVIVRWSPEAFERVEEADTLEVWDWRHVAHRAGIELDEEYRWKGED